MSTQENIEADQKDSGWVSYSTHWHEGLGRYVTVQKRDGCTRVILGEKR